MPEVQSLHSAAQSAAGYLYQVRLALLEALRYVYVDSSIEIAVEKLDDVSFEKNGNALELLQTKHHLNKAGDLTDGSVDLWKTLRAWSAKVKDDPSLPRHTRLVLITTAQAPTGSAASHLRPSDVGNRDPIEAEFLLMKAAGATKNKDLSKAIAAFTALTPAMRKELVSAIEIIDSAPLIDDLTSLIEERIRMIAPRGQTAKARERLEGWWLTSICAALQIPTSETISVLEIEHKLDDIRESLKRDSLPFDMEDVDPLQEELDALNQMRFVRQLRSIGTGATRLQYAKRDFYRASAQRSQWARRRLILDDEVGRFDRTLVEEWQPRYAQMCDSLAGICEEAALREAGQQLYNWVESDARFPLRSAVRRFLNVGSYHILADDLRLGWHRDYETLCADSNNGDLDDG